MHLKTKHLINVHMGSTGVSAYVIETEQSSEALAEIQSMFGFQGTHHITYMGEIVDVGSEIRDQVVKLRAALDEYNTAGNEVVNIGVALGHIIAHAHLLTSRLEARL